MTSTLVRALSEPRGLPQPAELFVPRPGDERRLRPRLVFRTTRSHAFFHSLGELRAQHHVARMELSICAPAANVKQPAKPGSRKEQMAKGRRPATRRRTSSRAPPLAAPTKAAARRFRYPSKAAPSPSAPLHERLSLPAPAAPGRARLSAPSAKAEQARAQAAAHAGHARVLHVHRASSSKARRARRLRGDQSLLYANLGSVAACPSQGWSRTMPRSPPDRQMTHRPLIFRPYDEERLPLASCRGGRKAVGVVFVEGIRACAFGEFVRSRAETPKTSMPVASLGGICLMAEPDLSCGEYREGLAVGVGRITRGERSGPLRCRCGRCHAGRRGGGVDADGRLKRPPAPPERRATASAVTDVTLPPVRRRINLSSELCVMNSAR